MMVRDHSNVPAGHAETPYALVTGLAANASARSLAWLLGSALTFGVGSLVASTSYWPLSALTGTLSTIALWGMLAHRAEHHPSPLLAAVQGVLVVLGSLLALCGGLGLFFGMLGPRWML